MATFQPGAPQSLIHPQLVTLRTAAALPAAGAYDVTPLVVACPSFTRITLLGSYTRAAALGAATMALEFCPTATGAGAWYRLSEIAAGLLAAGADVANLTQRSTLTYTSTAAGAESFVWDLELPTAMERVRCACAESGAVGNPGTYVLDALLSV